MDLLIALNSVNFGTRDVAPGVGTPQWASDGAIGVRGATIDEAYHANLLMGELYNLLLATGITPDGTNYTQIYQAILALRYVVDTGSVNALAGAPHSALLTNLPADMGLPDGFEISIVPAATNTTTTPSFAFNGGTARTITYPDGSALVPGDLQIGFPAPLMKVGGGSPTWRLRTPRRPVVQLANAITNLVGSSAGAVKTASWTADQVVAASASGSPFFGSSLTFSFNGATNGANGMAGAQSFPASGQLDVYAIYNPTTNAWACLGNATSAVGAKTCPVGMPSGYTASILLGSYVASSSNFGSFVQLGNFISVATVQVVTSRTVSGLSATSVSSVCPANTKTISGYMNTTGSNTSGQLSDSAGNGAQQFASGTGGVVSDCFSNVPVVSQTIYTTVTGTNAVNVFVSGYTI